MRTLLAFSVLVNYLAVLLAGNGMLQQPATSAEHPYVHADDCQQQNYLSLDCWDKCNADTFMEAAAPKAPLTEANLLIPGLDVHNSPEAFTLQSTLFVPAHTTLSSCSPDASLQGFLFRIFPPPKKLV